ncbi:MAG: adenylate/guanylate cyclase domain-containing protein, partial [Acidimicrobiales bacterium]
MQPTGPEGNGTEIPSPVPPLLSSSHRLGDPRPSIDALLEPPDPNPTGATLTVDRSFAFVDICGFTAYCERSGEQPALELLIEFRQVVRDVVARRGVRVSKWLGDGVMIVSLEPAILAAACAEIELRCSAQGLDTHAGIATGSVLLLEGDDYVGRTVNLAARLCDAAALGQTLTAGPLTSLPPWLAAGRSSLFELAGMDDLVEARPLVVDASVRLAFEPSSSV